MEPLGDSMKIVTAAEMREIDRRSSGEFGVPSLVLMENAGSAVALFAQQQYPWAQRIAVICGKGNNGGDGFVAARRLHQAGKKVGVLVLAHTTELKGDAKEMYGKLPMAAVHVATVEDLAVAAIRQLFEEADLLIDAVLGTGFKPPMNPLVEAAGDLFLESTVPVISVDVPSGADSDSTAYIQENAFRSNGVVTFTAPKPAHVFSSLTSGPIVVTGIGSPSEAIISQQKLEWAGASAHLLGVRREPDSNKGDFGHALVIGGSLGKSGAPAMASLAALKCGAGLVTVAVPKSVLPIVAGFAPELMTEPLDETQQGTVSEHAGEPGALQRLLERKTVAALGPGLSINPETVAFVRKFVQECELPLVLDADGLNAFAGHVSLLDGGKRPLVLTPHPGEMARLTGLKVADIEHDRVKVARDFALQHHLYLVLKGWRTLIARPDGRVSVNTSGNPGMAKGGSGDVLTGLIAGLIAQFGRQSQSQSQIDDTVGDAVCAAVYLHGLSADLEVNEGDEHTLMATDIIRGLPRAFRLFAASSPFTDPFTWLRGFPAVL